MSTDPHCIFCKIAAGTIPAHKVYEDDVVFAFLDIGPIVHGHTLVVPKSHHATIMETPPEVLAAVNQRLPFLARAVVAGAGATGCHVLLNNGPDAMQTVPHLHYHILPRKDGDNFDIPWPSSKLDATKAQALLADIRKALHPTP